MWCASLGRLRRMAHRQTETYGENHGDVYCSEKERAGGRNSVIPRLPLSPTRSGDRERARPTEGLLVNGVLMITSWPLQAVGRGRAAGEGRCAVGVGAVSPVTTVVPPAPSAPTRFLNVRPLRLAGLQRGLSDRPYRRRSLTKIAKPLQAPAARHICR